MNPGFRLCLKPWLPKVTLEKSKTYAKHQVFSKYFCFAPVGFYQQVKTRAELFEKNNVNCKLNFEFINNCFVLKKLEVQHQEIQNFLVKKKAS
jgi:hypothetical protein